MMAITVTCSKWTQRKQDSVEKLVKGFESKQKPV